MELSPAAAIIYSMENELIKNAILDFLTDHPLMSLSEVADALEISPIRASLLLQELEEEGLLASESASDEEVEE